MPTICVCTEQGELYNPIVQENHQKYCQMHDYGFSVTRQGDFPMVNVLRKIVELLNVYEYVVYIHNATLITNPINLADTLLNNLNEKPMGFFVFERNGINQVHHDLLFFRRNSNLIRFLNHLANSIDHNRTYFAFEMEQLARKNVDNCNNYFNILTNQNLVCWWNSFSPYCFVTFLEYSSVTNNGVITRISQLLTPFCQKTETKEEYQKRQRWIVGNAPGFFTRLGSVCLATKRRYPLITELQDIDF